MTGSKSTQPADEKTEKRGMFNGPPLFICKDIIMKKAKADHLSPLKTGYGIIDLID